MRVLRWRIDRTFDTAAAWWCIFTVFSTGERITSAMSSHKWVIAAERLQIAFDLESYEEEAAAATDSASAVSKADMKAADRCMGKAGSFLGEIHCCEQIRLLNFDLNRTTVDRLQKFLYGYVMLLVGVVLKEAANIS